MTDISFNADAQVAHVLAMLGYNESLAFGERTYSYDAGGSREISRLSDVIEAVMAQDPQYGGDDEAFCAAYRAGEYAPDLQVQ